MANSAMIFIFAAESNAGTDLLLKVENYDNQFPQICKAIIMNWQSSSEDYMSFVLNHLHLAGYNFTEIENN